MYTLIIIKKFFYFSLGIRMNEKNINLTIKKIKKSNFYNKNKKNI